MTTKKSKKIIWKQKTLWFISLVLAITLVKSHIISFPSLESQNHHHLHSHDEEKPFHECVHDRMVQEILGGSIMIHQPLDEETQQNVTKNVQESEGQDQNSLVFFLILILINLTK